MIPRLARSAFAAGGSASSEPRWLFLPFQLVLVGAAPVPVWGIGFWRLLRDAELRTFRLVREPPVSRCYCR